MTVRNLQVTRVTIHGMIGFQVQALYRDCSDSMYDTIAHAAIFRDEKRAAAMLRRIQGKPSWEWDWKQWGAPAGVHFSGTEAFQASAPVYSVI